MKQQYEVGQGNVLVPPLLDRSRVNSYKYPALLLRLLSQPTSQTLKPSKQASSSIKPPRGQVISVSLYHLTNHQHRKRPTDLLHPGLE